MEGRRSLRPRSRALAACALAAASAAHLHLQCRGSGAAFVPAWAGAASGPVGVLGTAAAATPLDFTQLLLAEADDEYSDIEAQTFVGDYSQTGPDSIFYGYVAITVVGLTFALYYATKGYWEDRWLVDRMQKQKMKFISDEANTDAIDKYQLGRSYVALLDHSSALAEFEEAEEDISNIRDRLDEEDAMGALAARAMLHNSKGYSLMKLEPPRTAQARREFVRAVTYWPEYPEALYNIGTELIKRKRYDVAMRTMNTVLKWQPEASHVKQAVDQVVGLMDMEEEAKLESDMEYVDSKGRPLNT